MPDTYPPTRLQKTGLGSHDIPGRKQSQPIEKTVGWARIYWARWLQRKKFLSGVSQSVEQFR